MEQYLGVPDKEVCSLCDSFNGTVRRKAWCKGCKKNSHLAITSYISVHIGCYSLDPEDTTTDLSNTVKLAVKLKAEDERAMVKVFIKRMLDKQDK